MPDERGDVVGHESHVHRPIDVRGTAVSLKVHGDYLVVRGELRHDLREHFARPESAVKGDDGPAGAVDFVVEVDAVDVCVLAGVRVHAPKDPSFS